MAGYVRAPERREQLLLAAGEVLVRQGLAHLTLRDVAAEAGVHLSTLQYIFASRADLVRALAERVLGEADQGSPAVGDEGLKRELLRRVDWYATRFVDNPAMLELLRHEYVAEADRVDPTEPVDRPLDGPIVSVDLSARIAEMGEKSGERYARPADELGQLWSVSMRGLFGEFLLHREVERFRKGGEVIVAALVALAQPNGHKA